MIEWLLRKLRPTPAAPPAAQDEAEEELRQAQEHLRKSEQEAAQAQDVAHTLHRANIENHFAERMKLALKGIVQ